MKMLKQGSVVNPTIVFRCSVCGSVFSANINELEMAGCAVVNESIYRFFCPVCGMTQYAVPYKEGNNDKN